MSATTDLFGLINVIIGNGMPANLGDAKTFEEINWGNSIKFLEGSVNFKGFCENFEIISNQNFNTVPFANFASNAEKVTGIVPIAHGGTNASTIQEAKTNLLLDNVDNTSDIYKFISKATLDVLLLKEEVSNKSTDGTFTSNSDIKYPTEKTAKTYVNSVIIKVLLTPPLRKKE